MVKFRDGLKWDIQFQTNWWLSIGIHIDHKDPSITFHLPGLILTLGRCGYPIDMIGIYDSEIHDDDPESYEILNVPMMVWGTMSIRKWLSRDDIW